ncbi:MAG TPA: MBL fold metallo-hydrolase [Baekduia sp.]|nr:MBL fold metallo-hydrolase [Baekduia sp.]
MTDHTEIDLLFAGREKAICCHRVGDAIVDPGPQTCSETLLAALDGWQPKAILLTHIHLDHAAAAGALLREWPDTELWVHESGARHMADPERLIASAEQIYGSRMDELWGEIVPVPEDRMVVLTGGEERDGFKVAYTPGHAKHHVCYLHIESELAFTGDNAGVRIEDGPILPPTPPPDIDLELWAQSIETVRDLKPRALALTHFGTFADVDGHLDAMQSALTHWGDLARHVDADEFERQMMDVAGDKRRYTVAMPMATLHAGLVEYWEKRT